MVLSEGGTGNKMGTKAFPVLLSPRDPETSSLSPLCPSPSAVGPVLLLYQHLRGCPATDTGALSEV